MYPIITFWRALRKEGQKRVYTALKLGRKENFGMATPNQEVVLRLDKETMERLVVGVADYLCNTQGGSPGLVHPVLPKAAAAAVPLVSKIGKLW